MPAHRVIAGAVAVLVTAAIVAAIVAGVGTGPPSTGAGGHRDSYCASFAAATTVASGTPARSGRYSNPLYGYAVTIPAGLMAYAPATGAARGIVIPLVTKPRAVLRIDATYDAFYDITAAGVHTRDSLDVRLFDQLKSDDAQSFDLAGVTGARYRRRIVCRDDPHPYVFDAIVVVRNREIYRLDLQTEEARLPGDAALLDALARSWSWIR